jgi:hypothetical protein
MTSVLTKGDQDLHHFELSPAAAAPDRFIPADMTDGTVCGAPTRVTVEHRQNNPSPIALDMTVTIPMSLDDVAAVLWILWNGMCCPLDEITSDLAFLHRMVLETYLAEGGVRIEETLCVVTNLTPAHRDFHDWVKLRAEVARIYGPQGQAR